MGRAKAIIQLARPRYTAQIVGIVAIASITTHGLSTTTAKAILSYLFLSISTFFLDDAHDLQGDRLVYPHRPIPQGLVTSRQAYTISVALMISGILLAYTLETYQFVIFITSAIIASTISVLNITSLLRAAMTAFLMWALYPFGAFLDLKAILFGLIIAFPHVGGSITKDFVHSRGDSIQGLQPPSDWSRFVASTLFFLSSIVVWIPGLLNLVTWFYIPPILLTSMSSIILGINVLKRQYSRVYVYGGIGMLSALAAFLLGGV